ncbi:MAG: hypothetical protein AB7T06_29435 [Kofleriaceae bacterium]
MLSARARAWLAGHGVTQQRPRLDEVATRRYLDEHDLPRWQALVDVETTLGGLGGTASDERIVAFGIAEWFGARRRIDDRLHVLVATYSPISWFMDEAGRIVEIDDVGHRFYESDSIVHRIEQLSLVDWHGRHVHRALGARGRAVARALDLVPIVEASDSRQRFWASRDASPTTGVLVRESLEPDEYGKTALVQLTWITAGTRDELDRAIAHSTSDEPDPGPSPPTTTMQLVAALVDFHSVHRPLLDYASTNLGYYAYPPYQWAQTGTTEIAGSKWSYSKLGDTGYRLENAHGVVVELPEILERSVDSIVVRSFTQYLATKGVGRVVLERDEVDLRDTNGLTRLLDQLASTHLLERVSPQEYRLVDHGDHSAAVRLAQEMAREHFAVALDAVSAEGVIRELLWGPRETWRCVEMGLITLTEGANLVVAHLHSRLIRREAQTDAGWDARLASAILHVLPRLGPQTLSFELIGTARQEAPRLDLREYDAAHDAVRSILRDLCGHLWEHQLVEFTFRVGSTYLPVDATVLGTLLEQIPTALGAIAARQPFAIDMREVALQMWLAFTAVGDEYTMVVVSPVHEGLEGGAISAGELLPMLLAIRTRFLALLLQVAPALEHHPWIRAWLSAKARG